MIKKLIICIFMFVMTSTGLQADLVNALNELNFPRESQDYLGNPYDSHGCFHFYPADIYLLYHILPDLALLDIKDYSTRPPVQTTELIWGTDLIKTKTQIATYRNQLADPQTTRIDAYPEGNIWIVYNQGKPLFKIKAVPGPSKPYYLANGSVSSNSISFDRSLSEATTPGKYYIFGRSDDFYTLHYKQTTIIPMWGKIKKTNAGYVFFRNGRPYDVPEPVRYDLMNNYTGKYIFNYFNPKKDKAGRIEEAQWASHDFGKFTLFWSNDKRTICNEMGYATGEVCFEQMQFLKDLAAALADPSANEMEPFLRHFNGYPEYLKIGYFLSGATDFYLNNPTVTTYLKLMYNQKTTPQEWNDLPGHVKAAYKAYYFPKDTQIEPAESHALNDFGIRTDEKYKIYGIERELFLYKIAADKLLLKFNYLRKNWASYKQLKELTDLELTQKNSEKPFTKETILYKILLKRIYFEPVSKEDLT